MILLGLDLETTGLDPRVDSVIEIGLAHWDVERRKPVRLLNTYVNPILPVSDGKWDEILPINGITKDDVQKYGRGEDDVLKTLDAWVSKADAVVAHNGTMFDKLFVEELYKRHAVTDRKPLWVDTRLDVPEPMNGKLICIAAQHGFLNPFPHQALSDVLTMLKILDTYDISKVIERAKIPNLIVVAKKLPFERKDEAKERGYYWRPETKEWLKAIKQCDFEKEKQEAGFRVEISS